MMASVLVVEDEAAIAELIAINLRHAGFEVNVAVDADSAQRAVDRVLPDLVLLDWMLPGQSGLQLARRWRADSRTRDLPLIMLTARADEADKITGLDAGADDYLTKPFSTQELLARIRSVLRRRAPESLDTAVDIGGLRLDPATRRVTRLVGTAAAAGAGAEAANELREVKIGPTEFRLLHFFMTHPERVHSRAQLLDRVWGDHVFIEERTVDVHVKRLREALAPVDGSALIETVRGAGYRLTHQPQRVASALASGTV
jgi:two-component system, OmpR family, phosphate regulon response regulator PhoB